MESAPKTIPARRLRAPKPFRPAAASASDRRPGDDAPGIRGTGRVRVREQTGVGAGEASKLAADRLQPGRRAGSARLGG